MKIELQQITAENLAVAVVAAREIFPYEVHDDGFWPEVAYKMSITEQNPRFRYYLAIHEGLVVGITGHYPPEDGRPEIWLGWFGVLPSKRSHGYGSEILYQTSVIIHGFGQQEMRLYSGDRDEERPAHKLYTRMGFEVTGGGLVDCEPVIYFKAKLPLVKVWTVAESSALPEDEKLRMLKVAKRSPWYDDWHPYCLLCTGTMARMSKRAYGFKCEHCGNMIAWDLTRLAESPVKGTVQWVTA